jgi:hypothetical protein
MIGSVVVVFVVLGKHRFHSGDAVRRLRVDRISIQAVAARVMHGLLRERHL